MVFFPLCVLGDLRNFHPFLYLGACCSQKTPSYTLFLGMFGAKVKETSVYLFVCLAILYRQVGGLAL